MTNNNLYIDKANRKITQCVFLEIFQKRFCRGLVGVYHVMAIMNSVESQSKIFPSDSCLIISRPSHDFPL